ncbi:MAG: a-amylase [Bacteroidetes bacterium]|nr:MAG: a-amylase [Bacteroidota bacterium]
MPSITLYFRVHQPFLLRRYSSSEIDLSHCYFNEEGSSESLSFRADGSYLPANHLLLSLIKKFEGKFKVNFSISGTTLELMKKYAPNVLRTFRRLVHTGCVEILGEPYYNSLSSLYSREEFVNQVKKHQRLVKELLGVQTKIFRNTELIHNNKIGGWACEMGFGGILCEGLERILQGRSINLQYSIPGNSSCQLLLRNASLSDDIAFRFGNEDWNEFPLTAEKFAEWIHRHADLDCNINLFMDYETIGIHKPKETGIFEFLKYLPEKILDNEAWTFANPSEIISHQKSNGDYNVTTTISWADKPIESCVWCQNMMQNNTLKKIYSLEGLVHECGNDECLTTWGRLQAADYFYYMSNTGRLSYQYSNPFQSAEEAHSCYTNILTDFEIMLIRKGLDKFKRRPYLLSAAIL